MRVTCNHKHNITAYNAQFAYDTLVMMYSVLPGVLPAVTFGVRNRDLLVVGKLLCTFGALPRINASAVHTWGWVSLLGLGLLERLCPHCGMACPIYDTSIKRKTSIGMHAYILARWAYFG